MAKLYLLPCEASAFVNETVAFRDDVKAALRQTHS